MMILMAKQKRKEIACMNYEDASTEVQHKIPKEA
jgi:hypothetical protein